MMCAVISHSCDIRTSLCDIDLHIPLLSLLVPLDNYIKAQW